MIVTGHIKGLQKGKLYLQKVVKDTIFVNVDSIVLFGKDDFTLTTNVKSAEMYFLSLHNTDKSLQFFGEKGEINIETNLKTFNYKSKITGSKNQDLLNAYNESIQKFNNLRLDLIKEKFDAIKDKKDKTQIAEIEKKISNINKRKIRYTINFAFNNAKHEISPYLVLTELYNLKTSYLDTIVNSFSPKVRTSKYGKKLIEYFAEANTKE